MLRAGLAALVPNHSLGKRVQFIPYLNDGTVRALTADAATVITDVGYFTNMANITRTRVIRIGDMAPQKESRTSLVRDRACASTRMTRFPSPLLEVHRDRASTPECNPLELIHKQCEEQLKTACLWQSLKKGVLSGEFLGSGNDRKVLVRQQVLPYSAPFYAGPTGVGRF